MKPRIFLASGIIDFYVNKKKYDKLKTDSGKRNLIHRTLFEILTSLTGIIEIRNVDITVNNLWEEKLLKINDLNYNIDNLVPKNEDQVTIRIFMIDLVGLVDVGKEIANDYFFKLKGENFYFSISNSKIV